MPEWHTVVCVKVVPKPEEVRVDPATRRLDRQKTRCEINPPDMNAMEVALALKDRHGGRVTILSMGPSFFEPHLRTVLAMGADHVCLLSDMRFAGADTLATGYTLAQAIRKLGKIDLILCGEESSDGATGQVPAGLAEWLDLPLITLVSDVIVDPQAGWVRGRRRVAGGSEVVEAACPAVMSVKTASNEPRFMDHRIKPWAFEAGQVSVWDADDLSCDPNQIGTPGSPTLVAGLRQAHLRERRREMLTGSPDDVARELLVRLRDVLPHSI